MLNMPADQTTDGHTEVDAQRRRLRWRSRRGLLENDILLTRFLDRYEQGLGESEVAGLHRLLDEPDNDLLDLVLARREPDGRLASPDVLRVLELIRSI